MFTRPPANYWGQRRPWRKQGSLCRMGAMSCCTMVGDNYLGRAARVVDAGQYDVHGVRLTAGTREEILSKGFLAWG